MQGVPGNGKFSTAEEISTVVVAIMYLSSVGHAAANFLQYEDYAFIPNYPTKLYGEPPKNKVRV